MGGGCESKKGDLTTFIPGTIVLQYVSDDARFVGVVVSDFWRTRLNKSDQELFTLHPDRYHICLVLGWFEDFDYDWSVFNSRRRIVTFPSYGIGDKSSATPATLEEEISLLKLHDEDQSRGLVQGRSIRRRIFEFGKKQREILLLVALISHYLSGGDLINRPVYKEDYERDTASRVFSELKKILPRK